jgi:uncharacterized protein YuzE
MKVTYDPQANAAYIRLREKRGKLKAVQIAANFLVDIDETGAVCGIELLNANEQLIAGDDGKLVFVNRLDGTQGELKVA